MIGKVIQEKRKEVGLTQAQLAELLGVTAPAVNRWEKDLSYPDATLLAPLARVLKTDINSLFSFYSELSDKERDLIVDKFSVMMFTVDLEEALEYIGDELHQNLSDGLLYKKVADVLFGFKTLVSDNDSPFLMDKIAEYYERAHELLPQETEDISYALATIYSIIGDADKAEEAWSRLKEKNIDKTWVHAEIQYSLKNYSSAISEMKESIINNIIQLSRNLDLLRDALYQNGDQEMSEYANESSKKLRQLFDIWEGFDWQSQFTSAFSKTVADAKLDNLLGFYGCDVENKKISGSPLFSDVVLGDKAVDDHCYADQMADILNLLKSKKYNDEKE